MSENRRSSPPPSDASDSDPSNPELTRYVTQALAEQGLLIPETPEEVLAHEAHLDETRLGAGTLPARLSNFEFRAPAAHQTSNVVPIHTALAPRPQKASASRAWPRYLAGFALGAAASSVFWIASRPTDTASLALGGAGTELKAPPVPEVLPNYAIELGSTCVGCCAGSACTSATKAEVVSSCASGRKCITCNPGVEKNAYKLRISAVGFTPEGRQWAATHGGPDTLQVCAELQGKSLGCRSAVEEPIDLLDWLSFPVATTSAQLVGGLRLEVRAAGTAVGTTPPLAIWASPVTVTPDTLCRGLSARLNAGDTHVGRVSVFFDDPYYLELGRASTVSQLLTLRSRFQVTGEDLTKIYETTSPGDQTFALVFGPTDRAGSEKVRWQLLDQNLDAPIVLGADFRGQPRPL